MAPQQQQPTPSPFSASAAQIVTVTVFSTPSSAPSIQPAPSGGSSANVPIGAIAGGVAGGVTLAVLLVFIWNYWGLVIKRTEKRRRKEARDILTVRENTRRNATARFKPQSDALHPILNLNPEGRRVKFLTRTPTWPRGKNKNKSNPNNSNSDATTPAAIPPMEEMRIVYGEALTTTTEESGTDGGARPRQPSLSFVSAAVPLLEPGSDRQKSESTETQPEEEAWSPPLELAAPSPSLGPSRRSLSGPSPTPSHATSNHSSPSRPSRSTRMRIPTRLPDPPATPPIPIRSMPTHPTRPSGSTPNGSRTSLSPSRLPVAKPHHAPETPTIPPTSTPPVSAVPHAPVAGPSTAPSLPSIPLSAFSWTSSPLRNSVLPSDRPVVMPRAKNTHATSPSESQPPSPTSTWAHGLPLSSSASYVSAGSGEPLAPPEYPDSLRYGKPPETAGARQSSISTNTSASAYSN